MFDESMSANPYQSPTISGTTDVDDRSLLRFVLLVLTWSLGVILPAAMFNIAVGMIFVLGLFVSMTITGMPVD